MTGNRPIALLVALAAACAACRGTSKRADTTVPDTQSEMPQVPRDTLLRDLEATVIENYSHQSLNNYGAYRDGLARDTPITLIAVTPWGTVMRRSPQALQKRGLFQSRAARLLAKNLELHLSDDGSVGWVFDEISYRIDVEGRVASIPVRQTSVYVRDFDRWVLVLEHLSYPTGIEELRELAARDELAIPQKLDNRYRVAAANELIAMVGKLHNRRPSSGAPPIADTDSLILMPDRDHELHGADAAQAPSLATLFGPGTTVGLRQFRIGVAKNKQVAWMASNLVVRTVVNGDRVEVGLRGSYLFVKHDDTWRIVQMHLSAPITERDLERRIFGE